ncbi:HEAT repeat-containing protein 1 homolog [Anopheles bellator]|uniref:HEAT repeat-containing protein 1 homolog n=1 Tax=Anopheles bellator TaxID=139047 RepID=UPI002648E8AF|nr:HEAT repeat-containing protein 1 homolog [Anopheles bellator]
MTTSLAAQLQRLAAPQSRGLVDARKTASILFEAKEAAAKDREVIFDIGASGLEELVQLNGAFAQFEETLFDKKSMDLQRSVENRELNAKLDQNIRKFFYHLSPYVMLQPAHKCLEWLIRRFEIHEYNMQDFANLILPYHETRIFVRCVQTMRLSESEPLAFLRGVRKTGVPMSKRTIVEHGVRHPGFLKTIGKFLMRAVEELDKKANVLQAMFAFYCTTVLGVLDTADSVTEKYVVSVLQAIGKGLASKAVDYTAASYMIIGQLVLKTSLMKDTIEYIVRKLCGLQHPALTTDATMLLVLIFQTQHQQLDTLSDALIEEIINCKWLLAAMGTVKTDDINIIVFYRKVLEKCLNQICQPEKSLHTYGRFCRHLLLEIQLSEEEAENIIQCVFDSYFFAKSAGKRSSGDEMALDVSTINLDSDDEDFVAKDNKVTQWYSEFLKSFERQYPTPFDKVVKRVMKGQDQFSHKKRNALRNVLGFLLQASYDEDEADLFENLFHYEAVRRLNAVKYMVRHLRRLQRNSRGKNDLLRDCVLERLSDDNEEVIREVLDLTVDEIVDLVGVERLIAKLHLLALRGAAATKRCRPIIGRVIELLTDRRLYEKVDKVRIVIILYPLLFPLGNDAEGQCTAEQVLATSFAKQHLVPQFYSSEHNCNVMLSAVEAAGQCTNAIQVCFNIQLLSAALPTPCTVEQADRVLKYAIMQLKNHPFQYVVSSDIQCLTKNKLPMDLIAVPMRYIIERVTFEPIKPLNLENQNRSLKLQLRVLKTAITQYCTIRRDAEAMRSIFGDLIKSFLEQLFPSVSERIEYLSHFYTVHLLDPGAFSNESQNFAIGAQFQIRTLCLMNSMLERLADKAPTMTETTFTNVLLALASHSEVVRECAMKTIEIVVRHADRNGLPKVYNVFLGRLLERREELLMDDEQLSLVLFMMFSSTDRRQLKPVLEDLTHRTIAPETPAYIVCGVMALLKLLDDSAVFLTPMQKGVHILESISADKERVSLDAHESTVLQLLIARFNSDLTELLVRSEVCQRLLVLALQCHKTLIGPALRKHCTPAILMIQALGEDIFETLPKPYAKLVLQHVVEAATLSEHPETNAVTAKLFKTVTIDAELTLGLLEWMIATVHPAPFKASKNRRSSIHVAQSEHVLASVEWKRGVTMLEHLQNKTKLDNPQLLVPKLFECLKCCLDFEEQSAVEYVKQIVLSLLHHCILKVENAAAERGGSAHMVAAFGTGCSVLKVELIVQCIRGTQNPQTHHHALLLLAHVARYVPEQVLHNMMEIFTFVGSSIVRQDDAYSFQIISKIIESIVPTIAQGGGGLTGGSTAARAVTTEQVIPILKIFSDIVLDVPEHRRILLYVKLLQTLGGSEFLWVFLGVLIESDVMKGGRKAEQLNRSKSRAETELSTNDLSKRMEIAIQIAREFEPSVIMETCTKLVQYVRDLPMEMPEKRKGEEAVAMDVDSVEDVIFNVKTHTARQLKHFKYSLVQFVGSLITSVAVINKIAQLSAEQTLDMKRHYQNLIVSILTYVNAVSKTIDRVKAESDDDKIPMYWRAMLNNCYDILEGTISLLAAETLIIVVHGLLQHRFLMVRRKVIELLNNKLQYKQDYFNETHNAGLLKLLDPLMALVKGVHDETKVVGTPFERLVIVQLCYISLRHLSKILTQHATKKVQSILGDLVEELHGYKKNPNPQILASLILCIGELCSNLGPYSINFLPQFMPMMQKFLKAQLESEDPFDMLTMSIVLLTVKIVDTLSRFLSPYLRSMLIGLTKLYALVDQRNDARLANIQSRLVLIWDNLATSIAPRVLIPAIEQSYHDLIEDGQLLAIGPLMRLLSTTFGKLQSSDFGAIRGELAELFLTALQLRCNHATSDKFSLAEVDAAEEHVIKAFVVLILKLSESTFRPLFYQVFEWSIRESSSNDRAITFFNLCSHVAEALKSLFVLFASDLVAIATKLLNATNSAKVERNEELHFSDTPKNVTLLRYVLKTLHCIALYDNQHFMNAVRFDMLLVPVTDQLENGLIVKHDEMRGLVIDCLSQMAVAVMDDSLWRQLIHQVLLKTRSTEPEVRLFALDACTEIARKLGESYVPLLPETIPFLAELMEDDNEAVEKAVHHACREIGRASGDDLQKYF